MSKLTNAQKVNSIRAQIQELRQLGCSSMAVEVERDLDRIIATENARLYALELAKQKHGRSRNKLLALV